MRAGWTRDASYAMVPGRSPGPVAGPRLWHAARMENEAAGLNSARRHEVEVDAVVATAAGGGEPA
ncbi:hypothetical protein B9W68_13995 [Streptomyces sp. CS227]|nr:hypothetical protein B9W68_13995 [Streptomyces sp. CS227]